MKIITRTKKLVEDIIINDELEIVSVEYLKEGSNWVLRVYIEDRDGNLSIEDCTRISRDLSDKLDEEDFIDNSYILEVSSPGVERPLRNEEDYNRFIGKKVFIKTYAPLDGQKEFNGTLKGLINNSVKIISDDSEEIIEIPYKSIADARLSVEF
ncbi:MAG: ribosome maturation factor RimP [Bacillota bacterium]